MESKSARESRTSVVVVVGGDEQHKTKLQHNKNITTLHHITLCTSTSIITQGHNFYKIVIMKYKNQKKKLIFFLSK